MRKINLKLLRFLVVGFALILLGSGYGYSQSISVSLPSLTAISGTSGTIPVTVGNTSGSNIYSFEFTINYDKNVLYLVGASTTTMTGSGGILSFNADTAAGKLKVSWARATFLSGTGTLVNLDALYRASGTSTLAFGTGAEVFKFNDGTPAATTTNGSVLVPSIAITYGTMASVGLTDTISIPITTTALAASDDVYAYDFVATFDKNIINVIDVVTTGTLSAGGTIANNPNNTAGTVTVAWAHSTKITGSGTLVYLKAVVVGRDTCTLGFTSFKYNDGTPAAATIGGSLVSVNRKPTIGAVPAETVAEGDTLSFSVTATDPDGDILTYSFTSVPAATGAEMTSAGAFTWTPSFVQAETYSVTYKVTDALGLRDSTVSTITVTNVNRKPVFTPVPAQPARAGEAFSLVVLATDDDGDVITYTATIPTTAAGATFTADTLAWTPTAAQVGDHTFSFIATDPGGLYDSIAVVVTVTKTNRAPDFVLQLPDTSIQTHKAFSFTYTAVDPDLDPVRFYLVSVIPGVAIDAITGTLTWTPVKSQIGVNNIIVLVSDGTVSTTSRPSIVTVTFFNNAPTWRITPPGTPPDTTIKENQTYTFTYKGTDLDPGDVLKYAYAVRPTGAVIDSVTGIMTWTPTYVQGRPTPYTNVVTVTDGYITIRDTSYITVQNVNRLPLFTKVLPDTTIEGGQDTLRFTYKATDEDGPFLRYYLVSPLQGPAMLVPLTGAFIWSPPLPPVSYVVKVIVSVFDGEATIYDTANVTVKGTVNVGLEPGIPNNYSLSQNYPNPFNPTTKIKFGLPKESHVMLRVYNLLGQEVATLINETKQAGYYSYDFNASSVAGGLVSGIYIYKITAGDFTATKKMALIK